MKLTWLEKVSVMALKEAYDLIQAKLTFLSENLHGKTAVAGDFVDACDYSIKEKGFH